MVASSAQKRSWAAAEWRMATKLNFVDHAILLFIIDVHASVKLFLNYCIYPVAHTTSWRMHQMEYSDHQGESLTETNAGRDVLYLFCEAE